MTAPARRSVARAGLSQRWDPADRRAGVILFGIVLFLLVALGWLVVDIPRAEELWYAEFDQVAGLAEQAPVQIEGFTVGRVTAVRPLTSDSGRVRFRVTLRIPVTRDPIPLPEGTVARLIPPALVGQTYVDLVRPVRPVLGSAMLEAGSTLGGEVVPSLLDEVTRTVATLRSTAVGAGDDLARLSDTLTSVAGGVRDEVRQLSGSVQEVVGRADRALAALEHDMQVLGDVLDDTRPIPGRTVALLDSLGVLTEELRVTTARVDALVAAESPALKRIVAQLDTASVAINYVLKRFARRPMRFFTGIDTASFPVPPARP